MPKIEERPARQSELSKKLKGVAAPKDQGPVWKGPEVDGITFSLLSRFLVCRERFRVLVVKGLKPSPRFSHRMEYGNMWHVCEESFAKNHDWATTTVALRDYCQGLCQRFPLQQQDVHHWCMVCMAQFPVYVDWWAKHPDVVNRTPLLQEQVFSVPYELPSGRTVRLRGKFDSVDLLKDDEGEGIWLQENKSKGEIIEEQVRQQLRFDLQTMIYLIALGMYKSDKKQAGNSQGYFAKTPIVGVRYNVVRRPLSGGEGTIVRHKATQGAKCPKCKGSGQIPCKVIPGQATCPKCNGRQRIGGKPEETLEHFYSRLGGIIQAKPETYFIRWKVEVSTSDVQRFRRECLDPILEQLCSWWEVIVKGADPFDHAWRSAAIHWRHPFGVYNPLNEGGSSELDEHLATGSTAGLTKVDTLFPELQ